MKALICSAAALFTAALLAGEAQAFEAPHAKTAKSKPAAIEVRYRHRHHGGGLFSNWCAYNCYAVPPCARGCYGAYGYSRIPYDEDLPFRYRWDHDAIPSDNVFAFAYPYTGGPFMRAGEAVY